MPRKEEAVWDRFARIYDRFMRSDMDAYQIMIDKMKEIIEPDERVLEIATGTGLIVLGLSGHVKQIDAVDFSPGMIEDRETKSAMDAGDERSVRRTGCMCLSLFPILPLTQSLLPTPCISCQRRRKPSAKYAGC